MAEQILPYMVAAGTLRNILNKMKDAQKPERFSQDFLKDTIGISGGNAYSVIPFLKRIGFLASTGEPTDLYDRFKNPQASKRAVAEGIRNGYKSLYAINENAHNLSQSEIKGIVLQITGMDSDSEIVKSIVRTFFTLKEFAEFVTENNPVVKEEVFPERNEETIPSLKRNSGELNLSYTINLNLPETTNVAVFDAIFKSLREHILG